MNNLQIFRNTEFGEVRVVDKDGEPWFVGNLAENYFGQGLTTPEAMSEKYCPHTPKAWAREVRKLL